MFVNGEMRPDSIQEARPHMLPYLHSQGFATR